LWVVDDGPVALPVQGVPPGWSWCRRQAQDLLGAPVAEAGQAALLLILGPRPATVVALRSRFPAVGMLALVNPDASMEAVVAVLEAGADTCVRSPDPLLLRAHLTALDAWVRRQERSSAVCAGQV
jgi:hypothetical protein